MCLVVRKSLCELVGTMGLTMVIFMTASINPNATVIAAGGFLACFCYAFGSVSGSHINPAVSVGVFVWNVINTCIDGTYRNAIFYEFVLYLAAQFTGAIVGGSISASLVKLWSEHLNLEINPVGIYPFRPEGDLTVNFMIEFFATCFFVLVILRTAFSSSNKTSIAGLVIGLSLSVMLYMCGSISGGGMNPAVVVGLWIGNLVEEFRPASGSQLVVLHILSYHVGPILGAIAAAGIHTAFEFSEPSNSENSSV